MRISSASVFNQGIQSILQQQTEVYRTQDQLSRGVKNLVPSDDPSAASRVLDLDEAIAQITQYEENANFATQRLGLEESTLDSAQNLLQRVRELAVQAGNSATQTPVTKYAIAQELREKLDEVFDYANTRDAGGEYVFSGYQSNVQAFTRDALGNFTYNGDQGKLALQIGSNRQVVASDSGAEVFQLIRNGNGDFSTDVNITNTGNGKITTGSVVNPGAFQAEDFTIRFTSPTTFEVDNTTTGAVNVIGVQTYTEDAAINFNGIEVNINGAPAAGDSFIVNASRNQDLFTTIQNLITRIENSPDSLSGNALYEQGIANALNDIDRAMENVVNVRTSLGARMNSIDSQAEDNAARKLQLQVVRSDVRDLDYAEAISALTFQTTALQIAQQTFSKVQNLSLFNFI